MASRFSDPQLPFADPKDQVERAARSWKMTFVWGALTAILGLLVVIDPGTSLVVLAILIGVEFLISGVFRLVHALTDSGAQDRVLWAIIGVALMLVGLFLIRHLHVTLLLVTALVGVFWIVVGIIEVIAGLIGASGGNRVWLLITGGLGVIAGIVVLAYPVGSLLAVALVVGLWLIIRGIVQMGHAWTMRHLSLPTS
jgi:uncharacterized membrane protein HdeD (DUF308 family)